MLQKSILLTLTVIAWTAVPAQAQWVVTPYLGANLAGDAEFRRGGPGVSVAYFGNNLGFEFDIERYNHFFKDKDVAHLVANNCGGGPAGEPCTDLNTDAIGFVGNVVAPIRITGAKNWRPFAHCGGWRDSLMGHGAARCAAAADRPRSRVGPRPAAAACAHVLND